MSDFKYLAVKNWERYQPKDTKNLPWIRDYKDKDWDADFSQLTVMQRYMLDAICRLRGRHGRNLPNDPLWIVRATSVLPRERHNATAAIQQLVNSGFLSITNEQDSPLGEVRIGKEREDIKTKAEPQKPIEQKTQTIRPETSSGLKAVMLLPLNSGEEFAVTEEDFQVWKKAYQAVNVLQELQKMVAWLHSNPTRKKTRSGVKKFVNSWLSRAQDNPKGAAMLTLQASRDGPTVDATATIRERQEKIKAFRASNGQN